MPEQSPSELLQELVALNERPHAHVSPVPTPAYTATRRLLTEMCVCCAVLFAGKPGKQCDTVPIWEFTNAPTNEYSIGCNTVVYQMRTHADGAALGAVKVGDYVDPLCPQPSPDLIAAEAELLPEGELLMLAVPPSPPPSSPEDISNACCGGEMCITTEQAASIPHESQSADCDSCDSCMRSVVSLSHPQQTMEYACNHLYDLSLIHI